MSTPSTSLAVASIFAILRPQQLARPLELMLERVVDFALSGLLGLGFLRFAPISSGNCLPDLPLRIRQNMQKPCVTSLNHQYYYSANIINTSQRELWWTEHNSQKKRQVEAREIA